MSQFEFVKKELVENVKILFDKGYLMATGGNLSMRILGEDAFAVTPSNMDYAKMRVEDICILDFDLKVLEGELKPSVEAEMHGAIYEVRGDLNAIVHTHQVYVSALTLIEMPIPALFGAKCENYPLCALGDGNVEKQSGETCER